MDYPVRLLRYFATVAEEGSFTQAGLRLNASQPVVSCGVRRLESLLGFRLLDRNSRHVELTVEGERFLPSAREIIDASEVASELVRELRCGGSRDFRLGYPPYMTDVPELENLIERFPKRYPAVSMNVHIGLASSLIVELQHRRLDVALLIATEKEPAGLDTLKLRRIYTDLLIPAEHPLARKPRVALADLDGLEMWTPARHQAPAFFDPTIAPLVAHGAVIRPAMNPSFIGLVHSARKNRVITVAFDSLSPEDEIAMGDMVVRPLEDRIGWTDLMLARANGETNVATNLFWEFADNLLCSRQARPEAA